MKQATEMHLVYITEPAWFERAIPEWVRADSHIVVTESDSVVNQAVVKGIEVVTLGSYFPPEKAQELSRKNITQESVLRKKLANMLHPEEHLSEIIRGTGDLIYMYDRLIYAMERLLESCNPTYVTFVYGDRYHASVGETPCGGWLEYLLLSRECQNSHIRMKVRAHEFMSKSEVVKSTRYDRHLSESSGYYKLKGAHDNLEEIPRGNQENVLFLYLYEMCRDDLEPLTNPERWPEKFGVLTGKLSQYAPESISYQFDFSHKTVVFNERYKKSYRRLEESINLVFRELLLTNINNHPIANQIIDCQIKNILSRHKECYSIIESLKKVIPKHNIRCVVLTGYQSPPNPVIASYFAAQGVEVTVRQHGGISEPAWPTKCAVENCFYSANSDFYKNHSRLNCRGCDITSRKRLSFAISNKVEAISSSKNILVSEDLFLNATNKTLNIKFFIDFFNNVPSELSIVLRGHPRFPGDLVPGFSNARFTRESARNNSIMSSLRDACCLVCPLDSFSTVICDAIMAGVPAVVVAPEGSVNIYGFEPYAWGYPIIVTRPEALINIISRIKSDSEYLTNILMELNTWMDSILGKNAEITKIIGNNDYRTSPWKVKVDISSRRYIKMLLRTKIKLVVNRWRIL